MLLIFQDHLQSGEVIKDEYDDAVRKVKQKQCPRKTGRAYRRSQKRQEFYNRIRIMGYGYNPAAGYTEWDEIDGVWCPVGKYIKYPKNSRFQGYLKRLSNKRIRRAGECLPRGAAYRRQSEYAWELY